MPQEPDNTKMEELLKAYAKKRREASGNPLHPATRRLLQDEVARVYPKSTASEVIPWYKLLFQFWPRVAFAVGLVVLMGSAFWALNRPPSDSQNLSLARNETEAFRAAPPANAELRDAEQPVRQQSSSNRRGFSLEENAPAPTATPAPRPVLRASSSAAQAPAETEVALKEELSQKTLAEKRKAGAAPTELAASESSDRFYKTAPPATTAPAVPPATPMPAQKPAPSRTESQLARNAPRSIQPSPSLEKDKKQVAIDSSSALPAGKSLDTLSVMKEDESLLAKKETSLGVPTLTPSSAGVSGAPAGPSQTLLFASAASAWTNMASANLQSWSFQSQSAFGGGGGGGIGGAARPATSVPADANGRALGESESDFVGSFGNIGGDGRFARSRAQADRATRGRIAPTTSPVPAEPSQPESKNLAGATVNSPSAQNNAPLNYRYFSDSDRASYAQKDLQISAAAASGPAQSPALKVLDSFQLVQNGDTIQLVDADGSVYEGKLQALQNPERRLEREQVELQTAPSKPNPIVAQRVETLGRQNATAAVTNSIVFRASGLSRSLGQTVVVNGRLDRQLIGPQFQNFGTVVTPQAAGQTPSGGRGPSTEATLADQPAANSPAGPTNALVRISGTATIGGTNQIRLEAIPFRR